MSDGKICDVCGDGYELSGHTITQPAKIRPTLKYRVWSSLPGNRSKISFNTQDLCATCRKNLEKALKLLKEREESND